MSVEDEQLIKAIKRMCDPDVEPERIDSGSDGESEEEITLPTQPVDPDMERLQNDTALRQHLGIGSSFTGPKGVKEDYKFHKKQERARAHEKQQSDFNRLSKQALSSGWLQRTIQHEESQKTLLEEDQDEDDLKSIRQKRLAELKKLSQLPKFGSVFELDQDSYVKCIDNESPSVKVVIHLYERNVEPCRLVNSYLGKLATIYKSTKFCRIISTTADESFDQVALPAILVYQGGDLVNTLLRITDEIPGWAQSGWCSFEDFEEYLVLLDVLHDQERVKKPTVDPIDELDSDEFSD
ncbi:thioredoxin-like protein [Globomyces pollinis-pini]|nr:thioredoxin-like protein [Globomyces pollinis-pini]